MPLLKKARSAKRKASAKTTLRRKLSIKLTATKRKPAVRARARVAKKRPAAKRRKLSLFGSQRGAVKRSIITPKRYSRKQLLAFVLVFAVIGAYFIFRSFAATTAFATWEAEKMTSLPAGTISTSDSSASFIRMTAKGTASGVVQPPLASAATHVSVKARATACTGTVLLNVRVNNVQIQSIAVTAASWTELEKIELNKLGISLPQASTPNVSIEMASDAYTEMAGKSSNIKCQRKLDIDKITFYKYTADPVPLPVVNLSANPTPIAPGQSSTLNWNSTNAASCTASGAWSGSKPTSGSESTGPLNANATYTLSCMGAGGTTNKSVTVTIGSAASGSIYWGARMDGEVYHNGQEGYDAPWFASTWDLFEQHTGKKVSIDHFGQDVPPWEKIVRDRIYLDTTALKLISDRGAIPLLSMASNHTPLAEITAGKYDASLIGWANAAKSYGKPFFLRWNWEMNGRWFPWGDPTKNSAADYKASWIHIHDVIRQQGATNVTWVWCPNIEFSGSTDLTSLYPGDAYVDWTCMDGYNWGYRKGSWTSFNNLFKSTYDSILAKTGNTADSTGKIVEKPMMIAEIGSTEASATYDPAGVSKAAWLTDSLKTQLPTNFPQIKGLVWFNWNIWENGIQWDWQIESSPSAQAAFAGGIASPYYIPGSIEKYGDLPALTKVPTP